MKQLFKHICKLLSLIILCNPSLLTSMPGTPKGSESPPPAQPPIAATTGTAGSNRKQAAAKPSGLGPVSSNDSAYGATTDPPLSGRSSDDNQQRPHRTSPPKRRPQSAGRARHAVAAAQALGIATPPPQDPNHDCPTSPLDQAEDSAQARRSPMSRRTSPPPPATVAA